MNYKHTTDSECNDDGKYDGKYDGKLDTYPDDGKDYDSNEYKASSKDEEFPRIEITSIKIDSRKCLVSDPLDLVIDFELDRY